MKRISYILSALLLTAAGSDGVAARGLVNGRDPYRRYGRDLPDRTFTACQFKRITARHLRMKQFIGIAGGFISGPVFFLVLGSVPKSIQTLPVICG